MARERKKIGIIFKNNPDWTGGVYYILNLIRSLKTLTDSQQPNVIVFVWAHSDFEKIKTETNYPYLKKQLVPKVISYNKTQRIINFIWRKLFKRNCIEKRYNKNLDFIFPYFYNYYFDLIGYKIYWIPDFQERYLPQFFTEEELQSRKKYQNFLSTEKKHIVFSSFNALTDYNKFYPNNESHTTVLQFASTGADTLNENELTTVKQKFNLPENFFYVPNQFWAHKNHKLIIDAVKILNKSDEKIKIYFSGNERDYRNPNFINELKNSVKEAGLNDQIIFLGFIERTEVFALMKMALAIIQPSLFEGWSTVVEDAKSVNSFILASNIEVHREQLVQNALFFNPYNSIELSECMLKALNGKIEKLKFDYDKNIRDYANNFIKMVNMVKR